MRHPRPWSDEDRSTLFRMLAEGREIRDIATLLDRSRSAVSGQIFLAKLGPEGVKKYNQKRENNRKREPRSMTSTMVDPEVRTIYRPTPEMLADRARREAMPHRDLTGAFFGDPPVGLSALEGRGA